MGEDLQFQRRWEFRSKDSELHSSSDNSKSSCDPVLNRNKLAPAGLASFEDDETSGASRLLQENGNREPSVPIKPGKTRAKRRRNQNNVGELQGGGHEEAGPETGKARTNDAASAAMENAKKLFDDLKVATENLFGWMREEMHKLFEDQIGVSQIARRKRQKRNPDVKVKKPLKQPAAHMRQPESLQEKKPQSYDLQSPYNLVERSSAPKTGDPYNSVEAKIDKGKKIPFLGGSRSQTSPASADQNPQLQTQSEKTVVLAIEAQNSNIEKPARRKRAVDRDDYFPVTDKKIPETSPEQSFVSNPARLPPSASSHPTSLADKKTGNFFLERPNQMFDLNALGGYFPRVQPEERSLGCFSTQPKSRNLLPSFGQISGSSSSSMGPGFLVPHHPGMDVGCSLANQANRGSLNGNMTMGLTMNEGAIQFPGGNYSLLEHFVAKNQHGNMHSGYNPEGGRLLSYQIPNIREGPPHFSK